MQYTDALFVRVARVGEDWGAFHVRDEYSEREDEHGERMICGKLIDRALYERERLVHFDNLTPADMSALCLRCSREQ